MDFVQGEAVIEPIQSVVFKFSYYIFLLTPSSLNLYRVLYLNISVFINCSFNPSLNLYRVLYLNKEDLEVDEISDIALNLYRVLYLNVALFFFAEDSLSIEPIQSVVFKSKILLA